MARKKYINDLSGEGARLFGGRWNHKGTPILYTSGHCSLALLELLANTPKELIPSDLYYLKLKVPDDLAISVLKLESMPTNWKQYPAPNSLADLGTIWSKNMNTMVLQIPSVIVPQEWNYILNPLHPQFRKCKIVEEAPFDVDFRVH